MTTRDYEFIAYVLAGIKNQIDTASYSVVVIRFVDELRTRYSNFDVLRFYEYLSSVTGSEFVDPKWRRTYEGTESEQREMAGGR